MTPSLSSYLRQKLSDSNTYVVAFVVGTLINVYGHILVPLLRGRENPVDLFVSEFRQYPRLVMFSIFLAYCFPFCVTIYSAIRTRYVHRRFEMRAQFPDRKPDPVFRAAPEGDIVDGGDRTLELFERHNISTAQQLLGDGVWQQLVESTSSGQQLERNPRVHVDICEKWYVVSHSPAEGGGLNIYMAQTDPPVQESLG